jgi:hypothetical protein
LSLGLDNANEKTGPLWNSLARARTAGPLQDRTFLNTYSNESKAASMLLYSRDMKNPVELEKEARDAALP